MGRRRLTRYSCMVGTCVLMAWTLLPSKSVFASTASDSIDSHLLGQMSQVFAQGPKLHLQSEVIPYRGLEAHAAASAHIPNWTHAEDYPSGNTFSYTMVGTDPFTAQSSPTTTVVAPVIAVKLTFADNSVTDASAPASDCGRSDSPAQATLNSPIFQDTVSGTQYVDAFQRANFYAETSSSGLNPNYHLLLSGVSAPALVLSVPANDGVAGPLPCGTNPSAVEGIVSLSWLDAQLLAAMSTMNGVSPGVLPIFVLYDTVMIAGTGVAGGFHAVASSNLQTYVVADYQLAHLGGVANPPTDVAAVAHEVAEWADNPFGDNQVPTWGYVGQDRNADGTGLCQSDLEVADPLTDKLFQSITTGPTTYHVPDLAFASWFFRQSPSPAQNGAYTFYGGLTSSSDATVCPAQPVSVTATAGDGEVSLAWTEPATTSPIDSYVVLYQAESGDTTVASQVIPTPANSGVVTGLNNGTTYDFVVGARSLNGSGEGACPTALNLGGSDYDCSTFSNLVSATPVAKATTTATASSTPSSTPGAIVSSPTSATTSNAAAIPVSASSSQLAFTGVNRGLLFIVALGGVLAVSGMETRRRLIRLMKR